MTVEVVELLSRTDASQPLARLLPDGPTGLLEALGRYDNARDRDLRGNDRRFVVEGERVVRRFLRSGHGCESLLVTPEALDRLRPLLAARSGEEIVAFVADEPSIASIAGYRIHGGCLAMGKRSHWPNPAANLLAALPEHGPIRLIVAERVVQVENLGTLFRNAACFGCHAILLDEECADPLLRKTIRFSMGRVFDVPWAVSRDLPGDLSRLRERQVHTIALEIAPEATPLRDCRRSDRVAVVLGSEGHGLSPSVLAACDAVHLIPAPPPDEDGDARSLNVGVAAGIALYELAR